MEEETTNRQELYLDLLIQRAQALQEPVNEFAGKTSGASASPDNILFFHRRRLRGIDRFINIHHRHVLICCLETAGTVIIDEHTIPLKPGHSLLLFPLQFHHYIIPSQPINWFYITFELSDNLWLTPLKNRLVPINSFSADVLTDLISDWQVSVENSGWCTETVRTGVGYFLARQVETAQQEPAAVKADQYGPDEGADNYRPAQLMQRINKYVHDNISNDLSVQTIAEQLNISPSHLRLLVRTQIGMGLGHYIRHIRINHARRLLIKTDFQIDYITGECGFSSPQSFGRSFRKFTGISPLKFRQRNKRSQKKDQ